MLAPVQVMHACTVIHKCCGDHPLRPCMSYSPEWHSLTSALITVSWATLIVQWFQTTQTLCVPS